MTNVLPNDMATKDNFVEKRKYIRTNTFLKIYMDEDSMWGYLVDVSQYGLKAWLDKSENEVEDNFSLYIRPPKVFNIGDVEFEVEKVWVNYNKSTRYSEVGCRFKDLSEEQKAKLRQIIHFFQENDGF